MKLRVVQAERPDDRKKEDQYFLQMYRSLLDEITLILQMPGSPSYSDIPKVLREKLKK